MADSKFTPAPWRRCGGATPAYSAIHSERGYIVFRFADATIDQEHGKPIQAPDMWEQMANAHLIAAAPELYRALTFLLDEAEFAVKYIPKPAETLRKRFEEGIVWSREVLAQARGEQL